MERTETDGELMAQVATGDRAAFGRLIDRHKDAVMGYLVRLTGSEDRADDLAQESFLKIFQAAGRYADDGRFRPYLFRIATNLARDEARREQRRRMLAAMFFLPVEADPRPDPQSAAIGGQVERAVRAAIDELPVDQRAVVLLHELEGWPLEEIARSLDCRLGTVKSRLARAREKLRPLLEPVYAGVAA